MRILIISDTHGDTKKLKEVCLKHKNIDLILHAGDSQLPPYLTDNILTVKGNCDYYDYPNFRDLNIEGYKIHIEHGHRIHISESMFLDNNDYDIVIFGHSHTLKTFKNVNGKHFFNPGSLTRPRDADKGSYIILNLSKTEFSFEIHRIEL